jgi:hypothetical protein
MNEHEQVMGIIRGKNQSPIELDPSRTALIVVDMQRYFTQPSFPFTQVFEKLSPGSSVGYLKRVRETVIPSIRKLLSCFRSLGAPVAFTAVGTEAGDGRELPCWLRSFDEIGLATVGKRVWPPVSDPSWEIDESLKPLTGEGAQQAFRRNLRDYWSRAAAPTSGGGVGRGDWSVERRLCRHHSPRSRRSRLQDDHGQRRVHYLQRANAPSEPRHLQHRLRLGTSGR